MTALSPTPLLDAERHRCNEREFSRCAESPTSPDERAHFLRMARTSQLLAKNAEWVQATDAFLEWWRR